MHLLGARHCASLPQAPLQLAPSVLQVNGAQAKVAPGTQAPAPLQVPARPGRLQDWQLPSQRLAQQTPWAQKLLEQSASCEHRLPMACLPQEFATQTLGAAHSPLVTHELPHRLPAQVKGVHERPSGTAQAPLMHAPSAIHSLVAALQVCWLQVVPLG